MRLLLVAALGAALACDSAGSASETIGPSPRVAVTVDPALACITIAAERDVYADLSRPVRYTDARYRRPDGSFRMVELTVAERAMRLGRNEERARRYGCRYNAMVLELYERQDTAGLVAAVKGRTR